MTTQPVSFQVDQFECVTATPGTVLLRVAGRWWGPGQEWLPPPELLLDDGNRTHRLTALPGPDDIAPLAAPDAPPWRAAFSAPAALTHHSSTRFALDIGPYGLVDLPPPTARRTRSPAPPSETIRRREPEAPGAAADDHRRGREGREAAATERRAAMRDLERRLEQERTTRAAAEQRAEAERDARVRLGEAAETDRQAFGERLAALEASLREQTRMREAAEQAERDAAEQTRLAHEELEALLADERALRWQAEEAIDELRTAARAEIIRLRDHAEESQEALARAAEETASVRAHAQAELDEERERAATELAAREEDVEAAHAATAAVRREERAQAEERLEQVRAEAISALAAERAAREQEHEVATALSAERERLLGELAAAETALEQSRQEAEASVQAERRAAEGQLRQVEAAGAEAIASERDQFDADLREAARQAERERERVSALEAILDRVAAEAQELAQEVERRGETQRLAESRLAEAVETRDASDLRAETDRAEAAEATSGRDAAEARAGAAEEEAERLGTHIAELEERLADLRSEADRAAAVATEDLRVQAAALAEAVDLAEQRARVAEENAERAAEALVAADEETARARLQATEAEAEASRTADRTAETDREVARLQAALGAAEAARTTTEAELGSAEERIRVLSGRLADVRSEQSALQAGLEETKATVAAALEGLAREQETAAAPDARAEAERELVATRDRISELEVDLGQVTAPPEAQPRKPAHPPAVRERRLTPRSWSWFPIGLALASIAAAVTAIAYTFGPLFALAGPFSIAAVALIFHRPIWGVYAALLAVPGESLNLSLGSFGLTPSETLFLLVALAASLRFLGTGHARALHPAHTAFLLLQAVTIIGMLVAQDGFTLLKIWVDWSAFLVVSILVASASLAQIRNIVYCIAAAAAALALESLASGTSQTLVDGGLAATDRAQGAFTHPAQLAFFLVLAVPLALSLVVSGRPGLRPVMLAVASVATVALVMTLTRGSIVGFVASLAVLVTWARFRRLAGLLLAVGVVVVAANFSAIAESQQVSVVSTRLGTISQGARAGGGRLEIWRTAPRIIADHPFLGVGAGNFSTVSLSYGLSEGGDPFEHAHNLPLTVAAERGLGGLALLAFFIGALVRTGIRVLRARDQRTYPYALGLSAALLGLGVNALVDYPVQAAVMGTLMVEVGALIAVGRHLDAQALAEGTRRFANRTLLTDREPSDDRAARARTIRAERRFPVTADFATTKQPAEFRRRPSVRR